jgi:hypothetical protein
VARKLAVPDLTTTVLTMTLAGIGADFAVGHRGHVTLMRRLLVMATVQADGVLGAWLVLNVGVVVPLAMATGLLIVVAACAVLASRNSAEWRPLAPAKPVRATASAPAQTPPPNRG